MSVSACLFDLAMLRCVAIPYFLKSIILSFHFNFSLILLYVSYCIFRAVLHCVTCNRVLPFFLVDITPILLLRERTAGAWQVSAGPIPSPPLAASHLADEAAKVWIRFALKFATLKCPIVSSRGSATFTEVVDHWKSNIFCKRFC